LNGRTSVSPSRSMQHRSISREMEIMMAVSEAAYGTLDVDTVCGRSLESVMSGFQTAAAEIFLLDRETGMLLARAQRGLSPDFMGTGVLAWGEGLSGAVAEKGEPVFLESLSDETRLDPHQINREGFVSYAGIPLNHGSQCIGVMGLFTKTAWDFSEPEKTALAKMGGVIGSALSNARLYEDAMNRTSRFLAVSRTITMTRQLGTIQEIMQDIAKVLVQSLDYDLAWIGMADESGRLRGMAGFGLPMTQERVEVSDPIRSESRSVAVEAFLSQKTVVVPFLEDLPKGRFRTWAEKLKIQSLAAIPILGERPLGVMVVCYLREEDFNEEDIKTLVSVAEQAAIAIENARLYEEMKTSGERYRALFESAGTSFALLDESLTFRLVNPAFEALSGYSQDELVGKRRLMEFLKFDGTPWEKPVHGTSIPGETQIVDRDGFIRQVHVTVTRIPGSDESLVSIIDMTKQKELERQLFRNEELVAVGELSAGIAHEIRNPLSAILNSVSLLQEEPHLSGEGRQLLDVVKEESGHLAAIVDDFLKYARPKVPQFQEVDLNKLTVDTLSRHRDRHADQITWEETYDESLPEIEIDRHQIQQVIANLLTNGLDSMPEGGTLTVRTGREIRRDETWTFVQVSDTGVGIPKSEMQRIFQPFYSTKEKGTGMGLAICRRIVAEHRGEITAESEPGKGTRFILWLPVRHPSGTGSNQD
jgi:PAS domain S-box-containing protein